jgi:predicted Zn-ribbon and HTH transcriptional regulator
MKNTVYAIVIAVCIVLAVVVFIATRAGDGTGIDAISETEQVWVKCRACNTAYEMGKKQYYEDIEEKAKANPTPMMLTPGLTCQKCGKDKIFEAEKCENCGEVFFLNSVPADFADRCPKCKHSKTEAKRKAALEEQGR